MTEKEKAIEDETIELPTGPAEKKKPHRLHRQRLFRQHVHTEWRLARGIFLGLHRKHPLQLGRK